MKFVILGAGAIGAYVGAGLSRGGADVTLIARGPHLRAMEEHGVQILSPGGDFVAYPNVTDDFGAISSADVVVIALKAHSLPMLAPEIGELLGPHAATIWAQNGIPWWYFHSYSGPLEGTVLQSVDPGGVIARSIPETSVIGCVVYCSTEIIEPGVIRHVEGTRFVIGEPDGLVSDRCQEISQSFVAGGMKAPIEKQLRDQIWLKLVGNAAFNPITALTRATLGELGEVPEMIDTLRAIFTECAAVAERLGIRFPISLERRLAAGFAVGNHKTSMLQDLEAGKQLELDCMTGAIIELADTIGIAVPHIRTVYACAKLLDRVSNKIQD